MIKKRKINVVMLYNDWPLNETLYESLVNDASFNVYAISRWPKNTSTFGRSIKTYSNKYPENIWRFAPDLIVIDYPYDSDVLKENYYDISSLAKYAKILYIPYGPPYVAKHGHSLNSDNLRYIWKICVQSEYNKNLVLKETKLKRSQLIVTGWPRHDILLNIKKTNLEAECTIWNLDKNKDKDVKRILWTPHHYHKGTKLSYSGFLKYKDYFLGLVKNNPKFDIVLRPHPGLFNSLLTNQLISMDELEDFKRKFNSFPNASIYTNDECKLKLLCSSDYMINDSISFLSDYLVVNKPMLHLHDPKDSPGYTAYGNKIIMAHYTAKDENEINDFIQNIIIDNNDPKKNLRSRIRQKYLFFPKNGSGNYIKKYIKKEFLINKNRSLAYGEVKKKLCSYDLIIIKTLVSQESDNRKQLFLDINFGCKNILASNFFDAVDYTGCVFNCDDYKKYQSLFYHEKNINFIMTDFCGQAIPAVDIVLCLHIMPDTSEIEAMNFIQSLKNSKINFLLTTTRIFNILFSASKNKMLAINTKFMSKYCLISVKEVMLLSFDINLVSNSGLTRTLDLLENIILIIKLNMGCGEYLIFLKTAVKDYRELNKFAADNNFLQSDWSIYLDFFSFFYNVDFNRISNLYPFITKNIFDAVSKNFNAFIVEYIKLMS